MQDKSIPIVKAVKRKEHDVHLDPAGFFVIEVSHTQKSIRVEHYSNIVKNKKIVSGKLQKVFIGTSAAALADTITHHIPLLQADHYMYLGRELQRAQYALDTNTAYEQGGC